MYIFETHKYVANISFLIYYSVIINDATVVWFPEIFFINEI